MIFHSLLLKYTHVSASCDWYMKCLPLRIYSVGIPAALRIHIFIRYSLEANMNLF